MRHFSKSFIGFFSGMAGALALVAIFHLTLWGKGTEPVIRVETTPVNRDAKLGASFASVVKKAAPSVVNIYTTRVIHMRLFRSPLLNDPFFRQFFGDQFGSYGSREVTRKNKSLGSGVIVSPDGYILTANHVVDGADEVKVKVGDKKEYTAKVVGLDPPTDVAILKIDAKDLLAITLADSAQLEIGDIVLAIGNPFGLSQTVTMGIISALGRNGLPGFNQYQDFIQTDAAINPGNSGGPLVDASGRVIGITTATAQPATGIGFAIPINIARPIMQQALAGEKLARPFIGIAYVLVDRGLAADFSLPVTSGAWVHKEDSSGNSIEAVDAGSPGEKAGIKTGDIITSVEGQTIDAFHRLEDLLVQYAPGRTISLQVYRAGGTVTVQVTLGTRPDTSS